MGTIVSRLELDHPLFLEPGTTVLHAQIESLYTILGDNVDTRFFTIEDLPNTNTATLRHNFKVPFASMFVKVWAYNTVTKEATEADQSDYTITATGANPTEEIDIQNNSGGEVDLAVTVYGTLKPVSAISDVNLAGLADGQVLKWDNGTSTWVPLTIALTLASLTDTTVSAPAEGHMLFYDNGTAKWLNVLHTMEKITNTNITSIAEGHVLHWDNGTSKWINALNSVANLTDTTVSAPAEGHVLHWDNGTSKWINALNSVANLTDTTVSAPAEGHVLHWNNGTSKWVNALNNVTNLTDSNISGATDGQVLTWNNGTSKWINADPSGGQVLFDYILDAGGGGDFTDFSTAIAALTEGQTLYIRNGVYNESSFVPITVLGIKVIGESRDGVVFNSTEGSWSALRFDHGPHRCSTERDANNTAWSATGGLGTLSCTNGSANVTYSGTGTDPVADDLIFIEPNWYARISSVDTGLSVITMDRIWEGDTIAGLNGSVTDLVSGDINARTVFKNMTITTSSSLGIRVFDGMYNTHFENILVKASGAGANYMLQIQNCYRSSFIDVAADGNGFPTIQGISIFNGHADCLWENISIKDCIANAALVIGGGVRTFKHNRFHFKSIVGEGNLTQAPSGFYKCKIQIDASRGGRVFPTAGGGANAFYACEIKLGRLHINTANSMTITAARSVISCAYLLGNLDVKNQANTDINIVTDSYIDGTLFVDSEVVISGSVAYDVLNGVPAQNNGYLF